MKKKKRILRAFLAFLNDKRKNYHDSAFLFDEEANAFLKQRKKENKIATKLKIQDLERQLASKDVNKTWRKGALIKITNEKFGHGFSVGDIVVALEYSASTSYGCGWECVDLEARDFWVSLDEGEVVG